MYARDGDVACIDRKEWLLIYWIDRGRRCGIQKIHTLAYLWKTVIA
jgi:hypothetical protein